MQAVPVTVNQNATESVFPMKYKTDKAETIIKGIQIGITFPDMRPRTCTDAI
jgi:hypothetical protein